MEAWRKPHLEEWGNSLPFSYGMQPARMDEVLHRDARGALAPNTRYELRDFSAPDYTVRGWYRNTDMDRANEWGNATPGLCDGYILIGQFITPSPPIAAQ